MAKAWVTCSRPRCPVPGRSRRVRPAQPGKQIKVRNWREARGGKGIVDPRNSPSSAGRSSWSILAADLRDLDVAPGRPGGLLYPLPRQRPARGFRPRRRAAAHKPAQGQEPVRRTGAEAEIGRLGRQLSNVLELFKIVRRRRRATSYFETRLRRSSA